MNAKEKILEFCKEQNAIVEIVKFENSSKEQLPNNQQFDYFCERIAEEAKRYNGIKIDVQIFEDEDGTYYECANSYNKYVFLRFIHHSDEYKRRIDKILKENAKKREEYYKSIGIL